jgi:GNAT superfamily N-acetyltransferase
MKIERMKLDDLDRVGILAGQLGYPAETISLKSRFEKIDGRDDAALFTARADDGEVVGWVQVNLEPVQLIAEQRAEITALIVDEKVRGRNVGKKLLTHAEDWAREKGVSLLRLRSSQHRKDAHRFYLRENYQHAKTSYVFTKVPGRFLVTASRERLIG